MTRKLFFILKSSKPRLYHYNLMITLGVVFVTIIINSIVPIFFKKCIDSMVFNNNLLIYGFLIGYGLMWMVSQFIGNIRSSMATKLVEEISAQLAHSLFNHLHSLSLRFHHERQTGMLANALYSIQNTLETLLWGSLLYVIPTLLELIIALCVMTAFFGIHYVLILFAIFLLFTILSILSSLWTEEAQSMYNTQRTAVKSYFFESLLHAESVKYFSGYRFESEQCTSLLSAQNKALCNLLKKSLIIQNGQAFAIGLGLTFTLMLNAQGVVHHTFGISDFVLIQTYILQFLVPLSNLGYLFFQFKKARVELSDALNLFDLKPEISDSKNAVSLCKQPVTVTFSSVRFGYEANRMIINDCSFTASPGKKIALVGATGAGKTTLVRLLFRLYEVTEGLIAINGTNVKNITQESLHAMIGYVPQDALLFNNTLYYNITYGQQDKTREEVLEATHLAGLDCFIQSLPNGLETVVGNKGFKISGGEKQRIALSRAFLKKPAIYIFDEATASLDSKTEKTVLANIRTISQNATMIVIAHRLSSIVDSHEILVLDKGCIVQRGTHEKLLIQQGLYAQLWFAQQRPEQFLHYFNEKSYEIGTMKAG